MHTDETIVPVDFQTAGQMRDDTIFRELVAPLPEGMCVCIMYVSLYVCCELAKWGTMFLSKRWLLFRRLLEKVHHSICVHTMICVVYTSYICVVYICLYVWYTPLFVYMCLCVCVCVYCVCVCMIVYTCQYVCVYACVYVYIHAYKHTKTHVYTYIYT